MDRCIENVIEFITDSEVMGVTFSQGRFVSKVKKLAKEHPEEVKILAENKDGSIFAHIPVSYLGIRPPRKYSEDRKAKIAVQLEEARKKICN